MKIITLIASFVLAIQLYGQDKIYLFDNSVIESKISEMGINEIKYKKFNNLDGPVYVLEKSKVVMVIFENGTHEVVNVVSQNNSSAITVDSLPTNQDILPFYKMGKNFIGVNYFDLVFKNFTLNYTRYLLNYKLALGLSASIGPGNANGYGGDFLNLNKDYFHTVLSVNFLPVGMKKVSYFTGLSLMVGRGEGYSYENYPYYDPYYYYPTYQKLNYYGLYLNNGVQFNLTKHFNLRSSLALGLVDRDMNGQFNVHGLFEFSAGIRF